MILFQLIRDSYTISGVSRSLDNELSFQSANQNTLFGRSNEDEPVDGTRESSTKSSFLSDSVTGISCYLYCIKFNLIIITFSLSRVAKTSEAVSVGGVDCSCTTWQAALFFDVDL